jgi:uroporphyrinogen decarboxylase
MKSLTPIERVSATLCHQETDRFPRGELLVEEAFLDRLYPEKSKTPYGEKLRHFIEEMDIDLVTLTVDVENCDVRLRELEKWANETTRFIMALVDGLFWRQEDPLTFEKFLIGLIQGEDDVLELIRQKKTRCRRLIQRCLKSGAHGVIIGDDLAYNKGPFLSPDDLAKWIFPGLREMAEIIKKGNGVAFLHSCGNLMGIVDQILAAGFDGVHGLAPSAGNDPLTLKQMTQKRLALMGGFEVDRFGPQDIDTMKEEILGPLTDGGGYIFGSSEGLSVYTPIDSFRALYSTLNPSILGIGA